MGLCLKEARKQTGMTQKALAEASGVSLGEIRSLEQGEATVTDTATMRRLAEALGVEVETLFFDKRVQYTKQTTAKKKSMLSCTAMRQQCEAYFSSISYTVTATREVPTGETDAKGHPIYEARPVLSDDGVPITYREYAVPPTIGGLLRFLKLSREAWQKLSKEPRYEAVTSWAMEEILAYHEEQLLLRKDVRGVLYNLQNIFGREEPLPGEGSSTISSLSLAEKMTMLQTLSHASGEGEDDR